MSTNAQQYLIRPLALADQTLLWEMLYQALYVPPGQPPLPREIIQTPELARYVQGWGREGDRGFLCSLARTNQAIGAVWLRLPRGQYKGYGYINDETPELSIAVLPAYRGQGVGTQLLQHLLASAQRQTPISLSVLVENPARRLYERFGFECVSSDAETIVMQRQG